MPEPSPPNPKRDARTAAIARRTATVARIDAAMAAQRVINQILRTFAPKPGTILSAFWSIGDEIEIQPLLHAAHALGCLCALPVVTAPRSPLTFRSWQPGTELIVSAFGIPEPGPERPEVTPDISIVPLLAFDRDGYRLGYGGGFFDRTIALMRSRPRVRPYIAAGVGFAGQEMAHVPREPHDERLDWIITEAEVIRASA
jgi:5-formyltetrahydrofolate cyclo-ligase